MGSYLSRTTTADVILDHLPVLTIHSQSLYKAQMFFIRPPALSVSCLLLYLLCAAAFVTIVLAHLC